MLRRFRSSQILIKIYTESMCFCIKINIWQEKGVQFQFNFSDFLLKNLFLAKFQRNFKKVSEKFLQKFREISVQFQRFFSMSTEKLTFNEISIFQSTILLKCSNTSSQNPQSNRTKDKIITHFVNLYFSNAVSIGKFNHIGILRKQPNIK